MRFSKRQFYREELTSDLTNKLELSIDWASHLPLVQGCLSYCRRCGFPLLEIFCRYCHQNNPPSSVGSLASGQPQNFRAERGGSQKTCFGKTELDSSKPCFILLIDTSASTKCTYRAPPEYKQPPLRRIAEALGSEVYRHLRAYIPEEELLANLDFYVRESQYHRHTHAQIIMQYCSRNGFSAQDLKDLPKKEKYISRRQVVEYALRHLLEVLARREPEAVVIPIIFNETIEVPSADFDHFSAIDIHKENEEELYALGQRQSYDSADPIYRSKQIILEAVQAMPSTGQAATGSALIFSFGVAFRMKHPVKSIILFTDGIPDVGCGRFQAIPATKRKDYYEELAIRFGIPSHSTLDVVGFSDEYFGEAEYLSMVEKACGTCYSIPVGMDPKGDKYLTKSCLEGLCAQMELKISRAYNACYQTRITLVAEHEGISLCLTDKKLQENRPSGVKCALGFRPGIVLSAKTFEVVFTGRLPPDAKQLRFSLLVDFHHRGIRHYFAVEDSIEIILGTPEQVEREIARPLEKLILELWEKISLISPQDICQCEGNPHDDQALIKKNEGLLKAKTKAKLDREISKLRSKDRAHDRPENFPTVRRIRTSEL